MSISLASDQYTVGEDKTILITDTVAGHTGNTPKVVISSNKVDRLFEVDGVVASDTTFNFTISKANGKSFLQKGGKFYVRVLRDVAGVRDDRGEAHLFVTQGPGAA